MCHNGIMKYLALLIALSACKPVDVDPTLAPRGIQQPDKSPPSGPDESAAVFCLPVGEVNLLWDVNEGFYMNTDFHISHMKLVIQRSLYAQGFRDYSEFTYRIQSYDNKLGYVVGSNVYNLQNNKSAKCQLDIHNR